MLVVTADQSRRADQLMLERYAMPTLLLMETAGRLTAEFLLRTYPDIDNFLFLCGNGGNGGDGLVAARYLWRAGRKPRILLSDPEGRFNPDTQVNLAMARATDMVCEGYQKEQWPDIQRYLRSGVILVDALLGTGGSAPRAAVAEVINAFRTVPNEVVALDLPSGLNPDTGFVETAPLRAAHTLAYGYAKPCHYVTPAAGFCGEVTVLDIGFYESLHSQLQSATFLICEADVRQWHRPRQPDSHEGSFGHALLAGGSKGKAGAIALATQACLEIGAGLATGFIPASTASAFHRTSLENMSIPYGADTTPCLNETAAEVFLSYVKGKSALAIGPGLDCNPTTAGFLREVLAGLRKHAPDMPVVLDADALNLLAENPDLLQLLPTTCILTPHPGEMARLAGGESAAVQQYRLEVARSFAKQYNVIVVLKGAGTIVAAADGTTYLNATGNPGMATAGSGDILTGAITGLLAQGYPALQAAAMGVYLHGRAGDRAARTHGQEGLTATKIGRALGAALRETLQDK